MKQLDRFTYLVDQRGCTLADVKKWLSLEVSFKSAPTSIQKGEK